MLLRNLKRLITVKRSLSFLFLLHPKIHCLTIPKIIQVLTSSLLYLSLC